MTVLFNVLGPVEVVQDGSAVDIGAPGLRFVLAVLLLEADRVVPVERLVDLIWPGEPPRSARTSVQVRVSRLRALLPDCVRLGTEGAGYVLRVEPDQVDAHRFQRLVRAAADADDDTAATTLREALALWRGPALAGTAGEDVRQRLTVGLEEARLSAMERLAEHELRRGRHAAVVDDLYRMVADHPARERPVLLLARALHAGGQTTRALDLLRGYGRRLADELGLDPGPELRALELALLRGEPGEPATAPDTVRAPTRSRPAQLPATPGRFRGRGADLAALDAAFAESRDEAAVLVVTGMPGVGKTALALRWAHGVAERFDDGQLFVDLRGHAARPALAPRDALAGLLSALGAEPARIPADADGAAADFRSRVAGKRMLVVLDNAASAEQVRPLLPGTPGCVTVVTSRYRLDGLVAREGARRVTLRPLTDTEAHDVLDAALGGRGDERAAGELMALCGGLPLALRIAAANVGADGLADLAGDIRRARSHGLGYLEMDDDGAVRTAFDVSYERLDAATRCAFRRLGLVPGVDATAGAVAALLDTTEGAANRLLRSLVRAHLVDQHRPGRYRLHDLLRAYAVQRASLDDGPAECDAAVARLVAWYVHATASAVRTALPDRALPPLPGAPVPAPVFDASETALAWLDDETDNLMAAVHATARTGPADATWLLAAVMGPYFVLNHDLVAWRRIADVAHATTRRSDDGVARAATTLMIGQVEAAESRFADAAASLTEARRRCREAGWVDGELDALSMLASVVERTGRIDDAERLDREVLRLANQAGAKPSAARALSNLGNDAFELGRLGEARELLLRGAALLGECGALAARANTLNSLGVVYIYLDQHTEALDALVEARDLARRTGRRTVTASTLNNLADLYVDDGRHGDALRVGEEALALATELGRPRSQCSALVVMSAAARGLGRLHDAYRLAQRALALADDVGMPLHRIRAQIQLAAIAAAGGEVVDARRHVEEVLANARAHDFRSEEAEALLVSAATERAAGDPATASEAARQALSAFQAIGHLQGVRRSRRLLAELGAG